MASRDPQPRSLFFLLLREIMCSSAENPRNVKKSSKQRNINSLFFNRLKGFEFPN